MSTPREKFPKEMLSAFAATLDATSLLAAIREFFDELEEPHKNGRDGQI